MKILLLCIFVTLTTGGAHPCCCSEVGAEKDVAKSSCHQAVGQEGSGVESFDLQPSARHSKSQCTKSCCAAVAITASYGLSIAVLAQPLKMNTLPIPASVPEEASTPPPRS